ncbi:MAG: M15 family metallopeptidase [Clostridia bacterium]|nr:M15 family metallopeptidase [Clostridia bacterium]
MRRFLAALLLWALILPAAAQAKVYESTMILVNKQNSLPSDYVPGDLSRPNVTYAPGVPESRKQMREEAARALEAMFSAALEDGIGFMAISGYRSYWTQHDIYYTRLKEAGEAHVSLYVAQPGKSEHQTGLAMDLGIEGYLDLSERFADTDAYRWLSEHAHEYGFIIRYPQDGVEETGYAFEPWHVRYLGVQAADVWASGLTLEAWYRQKLAASHLLRKRSFRLYKPLG